MSVDDGVYILVTRGRKRGKKEYRVAHTIAIENIHMFPNYPMLAGESVLNREEVLRIFGFSRVFRDVRHAAGYAYGLADSLGGPDSLQHGINYLEHPDVRFPIEQLPEGHRELSLLAR